MHNHKSQNSQYSVAVALFALFISLNAAAQTQPSALDVPTVHEFGHAPQMENPPLMPVDAPITQLQSLYTSAQTADEISRYLLARDWAQLERALIEYQAQAEYDAVLYHYAMGALQRAKGNQRQAIRHYEQIGMNASLVYPRFDLAMMYLENKQYRDAERLFEQVRTQMPAQMQLLIDKLMGMMRQEQKIQVSFDTNIEQTDNVNNAPDVREFRIRDAVFVRDESSLPQSATGIRYDLGAMRSVNVSKNHYLNSNLSLGGVHYWDNKDYNEFTARAELGYQYKDIRRSVSLLPFVEQSWLSSARYQMQYGAQSSISQRLSPNWQAVLNLSHTQKRYQDGDIADRYDGYANDISTTWMYQPNSKWLYHIGLDAKRERLSDRAESSNRQGLRVGVGYFGEQLGARATFRQGQRKFLANNFWYDEKRVDSERMLSVSLWHHRLKFKGFMPKLNYRYQETDSNFMLYDRKNQAWFVTIDKAF